MTAPTVAPAAHTVMRVSGQSVTILTEHEKAYFDQARDRYLTQTKFTEQTDLADLDRLLALELMVFRWQQYLFAGADYAGDMVDEKRLTSELKLYSDQISKVKESMGLTKKSRDDAANDGNFAQWLADLKARAKVFGIHRERQLTNALTLMMELLTIVSAFDRSDTEERQKLGFETEHEILQWIRETMRPEYDALDAHFREHAQQYWIRDQ